MIDYDSCLCDTCIHIGACEVYNMTSCAFYEDKSSYLKMPPCKIGDFVWAIKKHGDTLHVKQGKVSEMKFTNEMKLQIVVGYITRGEWGVDIFATQEEAEAKLLER